MDIRRFFKRDKVTHFPEEDFDYPSRRRVTAKRRPMRKEEPKAKQTSGPVVFALPSVFNSASVPRKAESLSLEPEEIEPILSQVKSDGEEEEEGRDEVEVAVKDKEKEKEGTETERDREKKREKREEAEKQGKQTKKRTADVMDESDLEVYREWKRRATCMRDGAGREVPTDLSPETLVERINKQKKAVGQWKERIETCMTMLEMLQDSLLTDEGRLSRLEAQLEKQTREQWGDVAVDEAK